MNLSTLKPDLFGGFAAAIVALPLALAFGVASGMGALAGLYGAIAVGFVASLFGGTPTQISGPTGPMTVVMAAVIIEFADTPENAFFAVVMAGALQLGFGFARFGRYIKLVPQPVVSGFMSGIGVIVIILQIAPLTGHEAVDGGPLVALTAAPGMLAQLDFQALILGLIAFAVTAFLPTRLGRVVPSPLLAVLAGAVVGATIFPLAPTIGTIPSGLPDLQLPSPDVSEIPHLLRFALVLAFLGSIDSLLTSLVADSVSRGSHDPDRELVGQGLGNMVAGFIGGIPGAGATMRTLVNIRAGGRTRASGMIHALVLLAIVLFFADLAARIPLAVLGGILLKVGIDIIDWRSLARAITAPRKGVVIMLATLLLTVLVDLLTGVAVGVVMAAVLFVARSAEEQLASARFVFGSSDDAGLSEDEAAILEAAAGRIVLFHVEGPLSFASARDLSRLLRTSGDRDVLAIDLSRVPFIDSSACAALDEVIMVLRASGDDVLLYGVRPAVQEYLLKTGVLERLGDERVTDTQYEALQLAQRLLQHQG